MRHEFTDQLAEWGAPGGALDGICVGRVHLPRALCPKGIGGPTVVAIRRNGLFDLTAAGPTMADLLDRNDRLAQCQAAGPAVAGEPGGRLGGKPLPGAQR